MMNIYGVQKNLRQRPPFQMIEKVTELTPGESAVGIKTVSVNDPWFAGHFPGTGGSGQGILPPCASERLAAGFCRGDGGFGRELLLHHALAGLGHLEPAFLG